MAEHKKPCGRPKNVVSESLDLATLHTEWDGCEDVRDRLRGGGGLLVDGKGEDIKVVLSNSSVLQPLVTRMSLCQSRPLPNVDALRDEVEQVYLKNKRGQTPEDQPDVIAISWKIRKLLTYLKMKVRRKEVSSVPRFKCNMWIWRNWKMVWNFFCKEFCSYDSILSSNPRCLRFSTCAWWWTPVSRLGIDCTILDISFIYTRFLHSVFKLY